MEIRELEKLEEKVINEVVEIHMESFHGFFLTFLGRGFLRQLYKGFVKHSDSGLLVAQKNDKIIGFLAYSRDMSSFYKFLVKKHLPVFVFYAVGGFLRKPTVFFRLVYALAYSKNAKREENYVELASIGVSLSDSDVGVGSRLIAMLKKCVEGSRATYIKLETDAVNNEKANGFYKKNGFVLDHVYETREKRKMNEYRYYL